MKTILLLLLLPTLAYCQDDLPKIDNDTLITTCGYKIISGTDIKLGTGTLPNGDFKYIAISAGSFAAITNPAMRNEHVGRRYNGHLFHVKRFRKDGNKKRGYTYSLILGGGNLANYDCDIESAIASGEINVPDEFKPKTANATPIANSNADELKKLKDLYDSGALTKDEYDSAKKKVLAKM